MAIFKKKTASKPAAKASAAKKKSDVEKPAKVSEATIGTAVNASRKTGGLDIAMVLIAPHVTEKATDLSEKGVYAFEVNKLANKAQIKQAVEKYYKVSPRKVSIVNEASKLMKNPRTNRVQVKKAGRKKAFVYLKSGDKIEFV